jgi:hypothetical protein
MSIDRLQKLCHDSARRWKKRPVGQEWETKAWVTLAASRLLGEAGVRF